MMMSKNKPQIQNKEISENYEYAVVQYPGYSFDNIVLKNVPICVLPFETDDTGKAIVNLFLFKYFDAIRDTERVTTLLYKHDDDMDDSNLDTAMRCINDTMKLSISADSEDLNRIFYLGEIELNNLVSGVIPCYGVNVTGLVKADEFKVNEIMQSTLNRVTYNKVLQGASHDYIVASSVFMLLTYLN